MKAEMKFFSKYDITTVRNLVPKYHRFDIRLSKIPPNLFNIIDHKYLDTGVVYSQGSEIPERIHYGKYTCVKPSEDPKSPYILLGYMDNIEVTKTIREQLDNLHIGIKYLSCGNKYYVGYLMSPISEEYQSPYIIQDSEKTDQVKNILSKTTSPKCYVFYDLS